MAKFSHLLLELNALRCMFSLSKFFATLNRFTQLRNSKVQYQYIFLQEALPSSLQKLPFNLRRSILRFGQSYNFTELQTKAKNFDQLELQGDTTRKPVKSKSII